MAYTDWISVLVLATEITRTCNYEVNELMLLEVLIHSSFLFCHNVHRRISDQTCTMFM